MKSKASFFRVFIGTLVSGFLLLAGVPSTYAQTTPPPREATAAQATAGVVGHVYISPRRLAGNDIVLGDTTISGDDLFGVNGLNVNASATTNKNLTLNSSGTGNVTVRAGTTSMALFNGTNNQTTLYGGLLMNGATGAAPSAGVINAAGLKINGVDVATSSTSYWNASAPGINYTAGPVSLNGVPTGDAGDFQAEDITFTGTILQGTTNAASVRLTGAGTSTKYYLADNTGGSLYTGVESSVGGGFFTGSSAYEAIWYAPSTSSYFRTTKIRTNGYLDIDTNTSFSSLSATGLRAHAQTVYGAVIGGYGTTNDVSIFNRAGFLALSVPANSTTLTVTGAITAGSTGMIMTNPPGTSYVGQKVYYATTGDSVERLQIGHNQGTFTTGLVASQIMSDTTDIHIASRDNAAGTVRIRAGAGVAEVASFSSSSTLITGTVGHLLTRTGVNGSGAIIAAGVATDAKTTNDSIGLNFNALDSGSAVQNYASIRALITDPTAGSEDASIETWAANGGTVTRVVNQGYAYCANTAPYFTLGAALSTTLPATTGTGLYFDTLASANKRLFIGDGTGYTLYFTKRNTSVNTDLFTFADSGSFTAAASVIVGTTLAVQGSGVSAFAGTIRMDNADPYIFPNTSAKTMTIYGGSDASSWFRAYGSTHATKPGQAEIQADLVTASGRITAAGTGAHTFGTTNTVTMTAGAITANAVGAHTFGTTNTVVLTAGVVQTLKPGAANDTPVIVEDQRAGADGVLGSLNLTTSLNPSATGGSRYGEISLADGGNYRQMRSQSPWLFSNVGSHVFGTTNTVTLAAGALTATGLVTGGNVTTAGRMTSATATITGLSTGALINTAGVVSSIAPSTSGNVLTSNGTTWESTAPVRAFGEIYCHDGATGQSIPTGATYTKLTAFTTDGASVNCTNAAASDKITITQNGTYQVAFGVTNTSDTNNVTWTFAVFYDGTEQPQLHMGQKLGTGADAQSGFRSGFIVVTGAPKDIDLRAVHGSAGAVVITPVHMNLNVNRVQ